MDQSKAVAKFVEFHRNDPSKVWQEDFALPIHVDVIGANTNVRYASTKVDPSTLKKPRGKQGYTHDHHVGVRIGTPAAYGFRLPAYVSQAEALISLGDCLGFDYKDAAGKEFSKDYHTPNVGLFCADHGHALYIIQLKPRKCLYVIWGGNLRVEARGIVG